MRVLTFLEILGNTGVPTQNGGLGFQYLSIQSTSLIWSLVNKLYSLLFPALLPSVHPFSCTCSVQGCWDRADHAKCAFMDFN